MNVNSAVNSYSSFFGSSGISQFSARRAQDANVSSPGVGTSSTGGIETYDFTRMSRSEIKGVAQDFYNSGRIDLTQLGLLQLSGPLGKVGANGEFVPFTAAERADVDSRPVDYLQFTQGVIADIESRGEAINPKSGYTDWKHILEVLQSNHGSVSGIDISA